MKRAHAVLLRTLANSRHVLCCFSKTELSVVTLEKAHPSQRLHIFIMDTFLRLYTMTAIDTFKTVSCFCNRYSAWLNWMVCDWPTIY